jgi:dolichol-phosphate mannosyltransferase
MTEKKLISLVIPVFNEADNLDRLFALVDEALKSLTDRYDFEFVFTDNHSTDATFAVLAARAASDKRIRVIRFSRNFGYQKSILTGYMNARGSAAVQLDADLQDPPALIAEFIALWEQGNAVVYGVRRARPEGWLLHTTRRFFYRIVSFLSDHELPLNAGDFRLIDRRILDLLTKIADQNPYIRGIIPTLGFKQVGVVYDRNARISGKSKFSLAQYVALASDAIVSQSIMPLRIATYAGLLIAVVTMVGIMIAVVGQMIFGAEWPPGWATVTVLILFGISLNALFLGIIGEYLGRMYRQSISRPITIVERTIPEEVRTAARRE